MTKLELLAPAKDYNHGVAAINAGADAIYIGAPKFGARHSATNNITDISRLAHYAHTYGAKIFVALNTILFEEEIKEAQEIAQQVVEAGADALIIQDMSYVMFNLDIPLHASTQATAITPEKVLFLQEAGFERVILERALSLEEIREIREKTTVELEAFIHGAICVSTSGQCYMGQEVSKRSGNRGECSQPCRARYNLKDERGVIWLRDKHILSLSDMNLSKNIPQLIKAGVTSFKIEGRLKDMTYLINSVAYYREKIDDFIAKNKGYKKASEGVSTVPFTPAPEKSFSRQFTPYFINGRPKYKMASFQTAKALGEYIGEVKRIGRDWIEIECDNDFSNGDGICYITTKGSFGGTNINRHNKNGSTLRLFPNIMGEINIGAKIYRNYNKKFSEQVENSLLRRKIETNISVEFQEKGIRVTATDITGVRAVIERLSAYEEAKNIDKMRETIISQMTKSGDYPFNIIGVEIKGDIRFMTVKEINTIRRELLEGLTETRQNSYKRNKRREITYPNPFCNKLDGSYNIVNSLSRQFYERCGFAEIDEGYDLAGVTDKTPLMRCKYCIRREIDECLKEGGRKGKLFIENNGNSYELRFNCDKCEMTIYRYGSKIY